MSALRPPVRDDSTSDNHSLRSESTADSVDLLEWRQVDRLINNRNNNNYYYNYYNYNKQTFIYRHLQENQNSSGLQIARYDGV